MIMKHTTDPWMYINILLPYVEKVVPRTVSAAGSFRIKTRGSCGGSLLLLISFVFFMEILESAMILH